MSCIKVLQILPSLVRGGTEAFVMNYYKLLDKQNYKFIFLSLGNGKEYEEDIVSNGGEVIYANIPLAAAKMLIPNFIKLIKTLKTIDYDIIHSNINHYNGLIFLASCLIGKRKLISHSHNTNFKESGGFLRRFVYNKLFFYLTNHLASVRLACGEEAGKALYGNNSFKIVKNAIDFNYWISYPENEIVELKKKLKIGASTKVYSNISRFDKQKNLPFLIDIFNEITKINNNSFLIIGGTDGDLKDCVIAKIRQYKLTEKVHITGPCNNMKAIYYLSDAWILPSVHEGLPFSLIEAQACGLPIVTSDNIDKTVDIGLDLIHYCSIREEPKEWAEKIIAITAKETNTLKIRNSFSKNGYIIQDNIKTLECIYKNSMMNHH